jgi:hypothetical protein
MQSEVLIEGGFRKVSSSRIRDIACNLTFDSGFLRLVHLQWLAYGKSIDEIRPPNL